MVLLTDARAKKILWFMFVLFILYELYTTLLPYIIGERSFKPDGIGTGIPLDLTTLPCDSTTCSGDECLLSSITQDGKTTNSCMCAFGYIDDPNRKPILTNKDDAGITPNSVVTRFPNDNSLEITLTSRMTIKSLKQQLKNCPDRRAPRYYGTVSFDVYGPIQVQTGATVTQKANGTVFVTGRVDAVKAVHGSKNVNVTVTITSGFFASGYLTQIGNAIVTPISFKGNRTADVLALACKDNTYILTIDIPDTNVVNNRATFAVSMFIITGNVISINIIGRIPDEIVKLAPDEKTINDKIKFMVASGMRKFCQLCRPDMGPKFPQCQWKRYNSVSNTGDNAYPLATQCKPSSLFDSPDTYCQGAFGPQAKGVGSKDQWYGDTHTMCGDHGSDVTNAKAYCKGDKLHDKYLCWVNDSNFFAYPDCKTTGFCCNDWNDSAQQGYTKIDDKGFLVDEKGNPEKDKDGNLKDAGYCNFANNALTNNIIDRDSCKSSSSSEGKQRQWIQLKEACYFDDDKDGDNKYEQGGWKGGTNCCIDWSGFDGCRNSCSGAVLNKKTYREDHPKCNLINGNCVDQCKWAGETHPGKPPGFCGPNTSNEDCK